MKNPEFLLVLSATILAALLGFSYLALDSFLTEGWNWSNGLAALGRNLIADLLAVVIIFIVVSVVLARRGLDPLGRFANSIGSRIEAALDEVATRPLEAMLDEEHPQRFAWDSEFLSLSSEVTLICRFATDFLEDWFAEFVDFLNGGGTLTLVLPDLSHDHLVTAMDSQGGRAGHGLKDLVGRTESLVNLINEESRRGKIELRVIGSLIGYDIYLSAGAVAIQAPYENHYRPGARCPVQVCKPQTAMYRFLADEAESLVALSSDGA